jgi:phosphoribosyl-dephospho-CoA transferase
VAPPAQRPVDSEDRVRQLYSQYIETRRKQNEPTNSISYESLASTLRESTQKLKEKHGANRAVDFEVVVKDGKTILRPVLK